MADNSIKSGYFTTPSNTPSGEPKKIAVDNPYLSKAEFLTNEYALGLNITTSSTVYTNGRLDKLLLSMSADANRLCRRWFDTQTIDETKVGIMVRPQNPQLVNVILKNSPYQKIESVYLQVLKWFIQIDISQSGYLQDFADYGYYKIVPLLSNSGTGVGSPMPAEIVDKTPLGVIWTRYTFGYGTPLTGLTLTLTTGKSYQAPIYQQLWAPDQDKTIYDNGVVVDPSKYTVDHPNGTVTFISSYSPTGPITIDVVSNESIPQEIKDAVAMMVADRLGQGANNALGANSYGIQTYNVNFGMKSKLREAAEAMLAPYIANDIAIIN